MTLARAVLLSGDGAGFDDALDDFYPCVTYLEEPRPGQPWAEPRAPQPLPAL